MKPVADYRDALLALSGNAEIAFEVSYAIAKLCNRLLSSEDHEGEGRDLSIRILDAWERLDPNTHDLWNDLVAAAGLYPYVNSERLSPSGQLRYETHGSPFLKDIYFTEEQLKLSTLLAASKSLIVSAPTSFGKSLLIEEVVASKRFKNIVVIQPTLALLDETRKKLQKYREHYRLIISTFQKPATGPNIFLLTGERVVEYPELPKIDFFVIDEFYKLSLERDDERAATLNCALYRLLKFTSSFYLLGPNIKEAPRGLPKNLNAVWFKTNFSTVAVNRHTIDVVAKHKKEWLAEAGPKLIEVLKQLDSNALIYCQSPARAVALSSDCTDAMKPRGTITQSTDVLAIVQWIRENIHDKWVLIEALQCGIAFHHGALPRHLGSSIVDAFNNGGIQHLFCTSTLIEGVNTTAKNVVLFDRHKGLKAIDFFDHRNIMGRSGRMRTHFIGNVYEFHPEPKQVELEIDIPLFLQGEAPKELLVQLDDEDLTAAARARLQGFLSLPKEAQSVIKRNKGLPVEGQMEIIRLLGLDSLQRHLLMAWTGIPNYHQLAATLELAWTYLLKPGESKGGVVSYKQLAVLTLQYCSTKSLAALIRLTGSSEYWITNEPNEQRRMNKAINTVLQVSRHWFEYKLPKLLSGMSFLQEYVFKEKGMPPGNYLVLAQMLENSFLPSNLAALLEYDVPASALRKISKLLPADLAPEEILAKLRQMDFADAKLLPYEERKLRSIG